MDDVVAHADEIDAQGRMPGIPLTPRFKALGPNALFPMLDVLVTGRGLSAVKTASARDALRIGLLEAVGSVRDARAVPVLERELTGATDPRLVRAAATALARVGTDGAPDVLDRALTTTRPDDVARRRAVLEGLHDCRRARAATLLVVDAPDMTARVARARAQADADGASALDALSARLARNPARL